jgi:hypothetical protein
MSAASSRDEIKQPERPKLRDILGPGLITGASDDDPSGIATYSQAGAQFGYTLGWTLLLTYPLMCAIQLISAHIGRVAPGLAVRSESRRRHCQLCAPFGARSDSGISCINCCWWRLVTIEAARQSPADLRLAPLLLIRGDAGGLNGGHEDVRNPCVNNNWNGRRILETRDARDLVFWF